MPERKKIHLVAGARPNFMKIAPLYHALSTEPWAIPQIVHTGQHYDPLLSGAFFKDLNLPQPHHSLGVGSGSHSEQTARVMIEYEKICLDSRPDLTVVVGDVNSTMAACITAKKLNLPVAHLEAGLRSWDMTMPEEINRMVTDSICDYFWTPSRDGDENLIRAGAAPKNIRLVGNIMIDSYVMLAPRVEMDTTRATLGLLETQYGVVTLHRPSNVDDPQKLRRIMQCLSQIATDLPLIFPIHPRTRVRLEEAGWSSETRGLRLCDALSYIPFMNLVRGARLVVTDSGGVQEETTYLGISCLTLRENTERPVTLTHGSNHLVKIETLPAEVARVLKEQNRQYRVPDLWEGKTAGRIVSHLREIFGVK